ncbi:MAG TPA: heme o synthase [Thermoanaerobaculia bacterium]|nr:heme o synthase [Thermoanaerobaculia bacterium]
MKADSVPLARAASWQDLLELGKPRISLMVAITTAVGLLVAYSRTELTVTPWLVLATLTGTLLLSAGSSALNMWLERDLDARMARTRERPLPTGRVTPELALAVGVAAGVIGTLVLVVWVNALTALLGVFTMLAYVLVYTPLKTRTAWSTVVGAISGATPPLMGFTALQGTLELEAWPLFLILYFWQLPHVFAIAWLHREDYGNAGFRTVAYRDTDGRRTATATVATALLFCFAAWSPVPFGLAGAGYAAAAWGLSLSFFACVCWFAVRRDRRSARVTMLASVILLPLLLAALVLDVL